MMVYSSNISSMPFSVAAAGAQNPGCGSRRPPEHSTPPAVGHARHSIPPVGKLAKRPEGHSLQLDAPAVDAIFPTVHSSHSPVFGFADEPAGQEPVQHWWYMPLFCGQHWPVISKSTQVCARLQSDCRVGDAVGDIDGNELGDCDGDMDGDVVGAWIGACVVGR